MKMDGTMVHVHEQRSNMHRCVCQHFLLAIHREQLQCQEQRIPTMSGSLVRRKASTRLRTSKTKWDCWQPWEALLSIWMRIFFKWRSQKCCKKHWQPRNPIVSLLIPVTSLYWPTIYDENDLEAMGKIQQPTVHFPFHSSLVISKSKVERAGRMCVYQVVK